ncbi:hypothetical protein CASFOL_031133 [Castilleja foliolosa]|uniref:Tetraspanin n=1 Tax=Castilleja foliolosa TaxID=1961234 RepID=A0ABD3C3V2_9LAMI
MSHFPRLVLIVINVIALIIGAYFIGFAHDISESSSLNECLRVSPSFIRWTVGLGSTIVVIGIIGSCLHLKALECFYLFTLAITTFVFIVLCLFVWAMLPRLAAEKVYFKTAPDGVWLREYGVVAQKVLANRMDWSATKACFRKIDTCRIMNNQTEDQKVVYIDVRFR